MAILVGIDEAGFGPILGPLLVSSTAFSLPHDMLDVDMWNILQKSVAQKRKYLAGRLLICDSKKAYSKSIGIKHLQRAVLSCLNILDKNPTTLDGLLQQLCPVCNERLVDYPWYTKVKDYSLSANLSDIQIASDVFNSNLASNNIKLLELKSLCFDVAHYNRMVESVKNKANVLFTATSSLIKHAWDNLDSNELQIVVDRQGCRTHYSRNLLRMFGNLELTILKETTSNSSYELRDGKRKMRIHFVTKADDKFLPTALASMTSKYLRELLVRNINLYFTGFHEDLKPTAGYWKDGTRFIADLKKHIPHISYDSNQLIRSR